MVKWIKKLYYKLFKPKTPKLFDCDGDYLTIPDSDDWYFEESRCSDEEDICPLDGGDPRKRGAKLSDTGDR